MQVQTWLELKFENFCNYQSLDFSLQEARSMDTSMQNRFPYDCIQSMILMTDDFDHIIHP